MQWLTSFCVSSVIRILLKATSSKSMLWYISELAPSPLLMVEDMPLVVAPDACYGVVLAKSSKADGEVRGVGLRGQNFGSVYGPENCFKRAQH